LPNYTEQEGDEDEAKKDFSISRIDDTTDWCKSKNIVAFHQEAEKNENAELDA